MAEKEAPAVFSASAGGLMKPVERHGGRRGEGRLRGVRRGERLIRERDDAQDERAASEQLMSSHGVVPLCFVLVQVRLSLRAGAKLHCAAHSSLENLTDSTPYPAEAPPPTLMASERSFFAS